MITRNIKTIVALLGLSALATYASVSHAAVSGLKIAELYVNMAGGGVVKFTGSVNKACGTITDEYGFDATTAAGKSVLSLMTAAQLGGKRVNASGTGSCANNRENLNGFEIIDN